jgi:hypothetical protein
MPWRGAKNKITMIMILYFVLWSPIPYRQILKSPIVILFRCWICQACQHSASQIDVSNAYSLGAHLELGVFYTPTLCSRRARHHYKSGLCPTTCISSFQIISLLDFITNVMFLERLCRNQSQQLSVLIVCCAIYADIKNIDSSSCILGRLYNERSTPIR